MIQRRTILQILVGAVTLPIFPGLFGDIKRKFRGKAVAVVPRYVPTVPVVLESFTSLTGFTQSSGGQKLALDAKNGGLAVEGVGTNAGLLVYKSAVWTGDPSTLRTIALRVFKNTDGMPGTPHLPKVQLGRGGTYSGYPDTVENTFSASPWSGEQWISVHTSDFGSPMLPTGVDGVDLRLRPSLGVLPYDAKLTYKSLLGNAAGRPTAVLTFDDAYKSQYEVAFPYMKAKGIVGTCYLPMGNLAIQGKYAANINAVGGGRGYLTLAQVQEMYAAGWDMASDGGASDEIGRQFETLDAWITNLDANRQALVDNGMPRAKDFICYGNGYYGDNPALVTSTIHSVSGTSVVLSATASGAIAVGMNAYGVGIVGGTTVTAVSANGLTVTLSIAPRTVTAAGPNASVISAGKIIGFRDESGNFYTPKVLAAMKAAGIKMGRTTLGGGRGIYTRFGLGDGALMHGGQGFTLTPWDTGSRNYKDKNTGSFIKDTFDNAIKIGNTVISYTHFIADDTANTSGIGMYAYDFKAMIDYLAAKRDAGLLDILTISQLYARDIANPAIPNV